MDASKYVIYLKAGQNRLSDTIKRKRMIIVIFQEVERSFCTNSIKNKYK